MAGKHGTTDHETETVDTATPSVAENVDLVVWQSTTMLDSEVVDGVPEDNVLRGID